MSLQNLNILNNELDGVYHTGRANQRAVVLVHGILGDKATTWHLRQPLQSFDCLIANDPALADYDVFAFGYRATAWRGSRIELLAKHLRTGINQLLQSGRDDLKPPRTYHLVLIAHSMGGLVCMRYLLDCLQEGNTPPVIGLILYGTPTTGTDLVRLANLAVTGIALKIPVVRWVASLWRRRQQQFDDMATASRFLTSLHDQWALRVVNGGHPKVNPNERIWLPVRVVTAEDDLYVSEPSAKGMYGAVDWQTVACSHTAMVKPTSTADVSYVHARTFLQMVRTTDRPAVQARVWDLSQAVWRTHTDKMIHELVYETDIHSTLANGRTLDPDLASAGLTVCSVLCRYRGILEADSLTVGISFNTIGQDSVWQEVPEPVCVHSVLLRSFCQNDQEQILNGIQRVMNRDPGQAWATFFPDLTLSINDTPLNGAVPYHSKVPPYDWLRRPFPLPHNLKSLVGEEVEILVHYQSVVPAALNVFRFPHRWLTHGSSCRITVNGKFEYFIPSQRLAIGQKADEHQDTLPTRRTVQFQTRDVMLPGAAFEVSWQSIAQPPASK